MIALKGNGRRWSGELRRETAVKLREWGWTNVRIGNALGVTEGGVRG
ncbi:MAG: hypothetical protein WEG36_12145 [Gemmatimonadota bacterium]